MNRLVSRFFPFGVGALFVLVSSAIVAHAEIPQELANQRVAEVQVTGEGADAVSARELGIPLGSSVNRPLLRGVVKRLIASGRWADIQIDLVALKDGVRVLVQLVPKIVIHQVQIVGNRELSDEEIGRLIGISADDEVEPTTIASIQETMEHAYAEHGFEHAHVRLELRDTDDPARKVLILRIEENPPTRIDAIRFLGDPLPNDISLKLHAGDSFDREHVESRIHDLEVSLREHRYFEADLGDPQFVRTSRGVTINVVSRIGPRYDVQIDGSSPLTRREVFEALEAGRERLTEGWLEGAKSRVLELYRRYGHPDATLEIQRTKGRRPSTALLRLSIQRGPQLRVISIRFPGATSFRQSFLRGELFSYLEEDLPGSSLAVDTETADRIGFGGDRTWYGREVPRPTDPRTVYHEPTYRQAIEHIRELYEASGYLSAKVGPAVFQRIDKTRATVVIPVVEGAYSEIYDLSIDGNEVISARDILKAAQIERGKPFSHLGMEEARVRVLDLYREHGYLYARVEPEVTFSMDRTRVAVRLVIVERFPVRIGSIIIRGLRKTSDSLVRSRIKIHSGELFRPSKARETEEQIAVLGVFNGVAVAPEDPDLPARVKNIVVNVAERPSQYVDYGAGVSTGEGLRGSFEYGHRNLLSNAVGFTLRARIAYPILFLLIQDPVLQQRYERLSLQDRLERWITASIQVPYVYGLPSTRLALDLSHIRDNERDFGLNKNAASFTTTYWPVRRLALALTEKVENNNVQLFIDQGYQDFLKTTSDPRLQRLLRVPEGESTLVAAEFTASLDFRDSPFVPTRGVYLFGSAEWARTLRTQGSGDGPDFFSHQITLATTSNAYFKVLEDVVLALQFRIGRVFHLESRSQTYPNRRFFLGGVDTMRGYLVDSLIPQDLVQQIRTTDLKPTDVLRGGDVFVLLRGELRFPIVGSLHGALFTDVGNLWARAAAFNPLELRPTAGAGLRLATPAGPLAFDYGVVLLRRRDLGEPFGSFHFSIRVF